MTIKTLLAHVTKCLVSSCLKTARACRWGAKVPGPAVLRFLVLTFLASSFFLTTQADIPSQVSPIGLGMGGFSYWSFSPFCNALLTGGDWIEYGANDWGSTVKFYNTDGSPNPQYDENGYPKFLNSGKKLRVLLWPYDASPGNRPAAWPDRAARTGKGKWLLTWKGKADIRLNGGTFVPAESSGGESGLLVDGRRIYQVTNANYGGHINIEAIDASQPVTEIKAWLPDPADPDHKTLEGGFWHPFLLQEFSSMNHLRLMDWGETNASPQQDWKDRRLPGRYNQNGVLNRRAPAPSQDGNRGTGMAWEHMIGLANAAHKDIWICIPHLATDDYVTRLAGLIRYGSDGVDPYPGPQASPLYPPLDPGLKVWVEYSNEIWSSGWSFAQGDWAQAQGNAQGISKAKFNARRFAQVWSLMQQTLGGSERLVRVAAVFTAVSSYTNEFLTELKSYGPTLTPSVKVDAVAPTTYFGNGIQDWVYEQARHARSTNSPWFLGTSDFNDGGTLKPVSVDKNDPYWTSSKFREDQSAAFRELKRRMFSGSSAEGGGPDATGDLGGFSSSLRADVTSILGEDVPLIAYEGGPSIYTDYLDGGDPRDDGLTTFMEALNRNPAFPEIYRAQMNAARSKGLLINALFVDQGGWGKYGQWSHFEYMGQAESEAIKWTAARQTAQDIQGIRPGGLKAVKTRPTFDRSSKLPDLSYGSDYSQDITGIGGDVGVGNSLRTQVVSSLLVAGLTASNVEGQPGRVRVSGRPVEGGVNYLYLRVNDDDGDAEWKIFSFYVTGAPGVLLDTDLSGSFSAASGLPSKKVLTLDPTISFSGLDRGLPFSSGGGSARSGVDGIGVRTWDSTSGIFFSVDQGSATDSDSTLASAIKDKEYFTFTLGPFAGNRMNLRGARLTLTWVRSEYHSARHIAVFTSLSGFNEGQQIFTSTSTPNAGAESTELITLPDTPAYESLTGPVELRLYFYGSQYAHRATLRGIKLEEQAVTLAPLNSTSSFKNVSIRARSAGGAEVLTLGFVLSGTGMKRMLIRAVGPTLTSFDVPGALADPLMTLNQIIDGKGLVRAQNDDWSTPSNHEQIASTARDLGAFALSLGSKDAALLLDLAPGIYTVEGRGADATPGVVLLELYEADASQTTSRVVNLSARAFVGKGTDNIVPGFVIGGTGQRRVLVRAVGPSLSHFGVPDILADPQYVLYHIENRVPSPLERIDDWQNRLLVSTVGNSVGAFPLDGSSRDAARMVTLDPGIYTVETSGVSDSTGIALVEVYEVP